MEKSASKEELKKEHDRIRGVLSDLERFMPSSIKSFDSKRVVRVFHRLTSLWGKHENAEEKILEELKDTKGYKEIEYEHKELKGHRRALREGLKSKKKEQVWATVDTDGRIIIDKLRKHLKHEETILNI